MPTRREAIAAGLGLLAAPVLPVFGSESKQKKWWRVLREYEVEDVAVTEIEWPNDRLVVFRRLHPVPYLLYDPYNTIMIGLFDLKDPGLSCSLRDHIVDCTESHNVHHVKSKAQHCCVARIVDNHDFVGICVTAEKYVPWDNFLNSDIREHWKRREARRSKGR